MKKINSIQTPFKDINCSVFDLLDGSLLEEHLANVRKSKKISVRQLKEMYNLGVENYNSCQFKEAESIITSYTFLNPYDHRGPGILASIYLEQKRFDRALVILNILKTYPTNNLDETMLNISLCHYKLSEFKQATATFLIVDDKVLSEFNSKRYKYLERQLSPHLKLRSLN